MPRPPCLRLNPIPICACRRFVGRGSVLPAPFFSGSAIRDSRITGEPVTVTVPASEPSRSTISPLHAEPASTRRGIRRGHLRRGGRDVLVLRRLIH
jgi:hypothetical protein